MITVLFFAKYRELLGTAKMSVPAAEVNKTGCTVASLKEFLAERGEVWREVVNAENTLCAVNQDIATDDDRIVDGDEVAFYPPVTGG
ncbi:MoaD/ThiS family protein [Zhongshania sp.]|uniref:MoaD/ThiS family protein n=1 Tax=Zhongshania sp. TaxID=1971902 RepID=UPI0035625830